MASEGNNTINIPILLWAKLVFDMRKRGKGVRESGAFLVGRQSNGRGYVHTYLCYDDIDPNAYQHGAIIFHAAGYAAAWKRCKELRLDLLADLHTHPGPDVRQSGIDQRHPMIPVVGHTAMIMPSFGHTPCWSLGGVGVYEYMGNFKWHTHTGVRPPRVRLTLW